MATKRKTVEHCREALIGYLVQTKATMQDYSDKLSELIIRVDKAPDIDTLLSETQEIMLELERITAINKLDGFKSMRKIKEDFHTKDY